VRYRNGHLRRGLALGPGRAIGHHGRGIHPGDHHDNRLTGRSVPISHWWNQSVQTEQQLKPVVEALF